MKSKALPVPRIVIAADGSRFVLTMHASSKTPYGRKVLNEARDFGDLMPIPMPMTEVAQ